MFWTSEYWVKLSDRFIIYLKNEVASSHIAWQVEDLWKSHSFGSMHDTLMTISSLQSHSSWRPVILQENVILLETLHLVESNVLMLWRFWCFISKSVQPAGLGTNHTVGEMVLINRGIFTESYWYWISVGALFGFTVIFNIGFNLALTYMKRKFFIMCFCVLCYYLRQKNRFIPILTKGS